MAAIQIVNPADYIPQIGDLLAANWAETGFDFPFAPNVETYHELWDMGLMFAVAACAEGQIIGYCTVVVVPHQHNPAVMVASNDALFVAPEYRHGLTAPRIIKAAEDEAKARGAHRFTWHCRAGTPLADTLVRHGYTPVDVVVMKGL